MLPNASLRKPTVAILPSNPITAICRAKCGGSIQFADSSYIIQEVCASLLPLSGFSVKLPNTISEVLPLTMLEAFHLPEAHL
jgi:hypothetical protein